MTGRQRQRQGPAERILAPYACDAGRSRGRLFAEAESASRTPFQRDRDRIVHSTAFRRLKQKTQVFVHDEGDHYRTRLTHTLEVAQIARSIARTLHLDEDLAEALALAHDLGHPPFGHAGERALDACMGPFGGFDHNAQSLRVVTRLERRYAAFDGLNLTWETLEGLVKHNGPLLPGSGKPLPHAIAVYQAQQDLDLGTFASLEAQVAALADDIAYDTHDLDDGLRAGLIELGELADVPLVGACLAEVQAAWPYLERPRAIHETLRRLIGAMVEDVVAETGARLGRLAPSSCEDIRHAGKVVCAFSAETAGGERELKAFLKARVYRHERVMAIMDQAGEVVAELFSRYAAEPSSLPDYWAAHVAGADEDVRARRICDFVAGMTDRFALLEHRRLFDETPELG